MRLRVLTRILKLLSKADDVCLIKPTLVDFETDGKRTPYDTDSVLERRPKLNTVRRGFECHVYVDPKRFPTRPFVIIVSVSSVRSPKVDARAGYNVRARTRRCIRHVYTEMTRKNRSDVSCVATVTSGNAAAAATAIKNYST